MERRSCSAGSNGCSCDSSWPGETPSRPATDGFSTSLRSKAARLGLLASQQICYTMKPISMMQGTRVRA